MVKLLAVVQGKGEGCDFTIGCNQAFVNAKGETLESAKADLIEKIKCDYGFQDEIESVEVYVVTDSFKLDMTLLKEKKQKVIIDKQGDDWVFIFEDGRTEDIDGTQGMSANKAIRVAERIARDDNYEIVDSFNL